MKSNQHPRSWTVRSVLHDDGRRAITLGRDAGVRGRQTRAAKAPPAIQRKRGSTLRVHFARNELSAFQPIIWRIRPPARRRFVVQPKLQLLNPW